MKITKSIRLTSEAIVKGENESQKRGTTFSGLIEQLLRKLKK